MFLFLSLLVNDCILMYLEIIILYIYNSLILYGCLFGVFFFLYTPALASLKSWVCPYFKAFINFSFFKFHKSCLFTSFTLWEEKKRISSSYTLMLCLVGVSDYKAVVALYASQGGHKITLTCKKLYIYTYKKNIIC